MAPTASTTFYASFGIANTNSNLFNQAARLRTTLVEVAKAHPPS